MPMVPGNESVNPCVSDYHTLHSLHCWYKTVSEQFGSLLLARHYKDESKVSAYIDELASLANAIGCKLGTAHSPDKLADLRIMAVNLALLQKEASRFVTGSGANSKRGMRPKAPTSRSQTASS